MLGPLVDVAEKDLNGEPKAMSRLTRRLLAAYDFAEIERRRLENYAALHRLLGSINRLELPAEAPSAPMCYPLVSGIPDLHDSLLDEGIALPLFWPEVVKATRADSVENRLARTLLPSRWTSATPRRIWSGSPASFWANKPLSPCGQMRFLPGASFFTVRACI